jgi:hypothetical protein
MSACAPGSCTASSWRTWTCRGWPTPGRRTSPKNQRCVRLEWLVIDQVEVKVELVRWQDKQIVSVAEAARVVDALRVLLQPRVLNAEPNRERAFRVDSELLDEAVRPRVRVRLPLECRALVHSVRIPGGTCRCCRSLASRLVELSPAALIKQVQLLPAATGSTFGRATALGVRAVRRR